MEVKKANTYKKQFEKLKTDLERWSFIQSLDYEDYIVFIDNDSTFVIFPTDDKNAEDVLCDFDDCVGNKYGIKNLLNLLDINFEEV